MTIVLIDVISALLLYNPGKPEMLGAPSHHPWWQLKATPVQLLVANHGK
jgi:hypothetical protein